MQASRVSNRLNGDHSTPAIVSEVIGLLKELEDDQHREPPERFTSEELAEIAESARVVIRLLSRNRGCKVVSPASRVWFQSDDPPRGWRVVQRTTTAILCEKE